MSIIAWVIGLFIVYLFYLDIKTKKLNFVKSATENMLDGEFDEFEFDEFDSGEFEFDSGDFDSGEFDSGDFDSGEFDSGEFDSGEFDDFDQYDDLVDVDNQYSSQPVMRKPRVVSNAQPNNQNQYVGAPVTRKPRVVSNAQPNNQNQYSSQPVTRKRRVVSGMSMPMNYNYTNAPSPLANSIKYSVNYDNDRPVAINNMASSADADGYYLGDTLTELIDGSGADAAPSKWMSPTTALVSENPSDSFAYSPFDDSGMNTGGNSSFNSFEPAGGVRTTLTTQMEDDIMKRHRNLEHMSGNRRDEVNTMSRGYVQVENRPAGLQDFSKYLTPYAGVELESELFPYTKPRYKGCFKDDSRNPALPHYLGKKTVRDCARASKARGFRVFGMQHGAGTGMGMGECRTGSSRSYAKHGKAYDCDLYGDNLLGSSSSNAVYY